ncbi:MAG: CAP domain-containing protein, partial [Actinomycetota bacterium]
MTVHRTIRPVLTLLVAAALAVSAMTVTAGPTSAGTADDEQRFIQLINQTRAAAGLPALAVHPELTAQARAWASSMAANDQLAHSADISAGITAPWTVLGENVGVHGIHDIDQLYNAFVASPGHYANLVDARYGWVGVGVVVTDGGKLWTAHRFMATAEPASTTTAPTAPPTTTPTATAPPTTT